MPDVVIKWPRCVLVFTEQEFRELLTAREDLWVGHFVEVRDIVGLKKRRIVK